MRYALAIAGLAAAAQAGKGTYTLTHYTEVTITSCAPTHTNCAYNDVDGWSNWSATTEADPAEGTWSAWDPSKPSHKTTKKAEPTGTWAAWDPSKPSEDDSTSTWGAWDPSHPSDDDSTATWGTWDPSHPHPTGKPSSDDSTTWGSWDPSHPSDDDSTSTWGAWDPAHPTDKPSSDDSTTWGSWDPSHPSDDDSTSTWAAWNGATTAAPDAESATWGTWNGASPSDATCPEYTATAPPAWFSQLPSAVLSSLAAKWTGEVPADWCNYSYSISGLVTKTPEAASATGSWEAWATGTPVEGAEATKTGNIAQWTGAANANAASFVLGAAAMAAAVFV